MNTTAEVRAFLIKQMHKLDKSEQGVDEAKAMCNYAQQVYNQTNLELKAASLKARISNFEINPIRFPVAGGDK